MSNRESLAALQLTFVELMDYWSPEQKNAEELSKGIFGINAILNLFLERNIFFIDEMDSTCDFKKRNLIYPIGEPAKPQEALFELLLACYNVCKRSKNYTLLDSCVFETLLWSKVPR